MRKSALAILIFATLSPSLVAWADDFSALLADLSFGDAPAASQTLTPASEVPLVSLQYPISEPAEPLADQFDLESAFALQESKSGVPAQTVGHLMPHADPCGCDAPEPEFTCTPHTPASLPTSSFYQYFRSSKCNTHVWDGYRQGCRSSNAHVNGTCDCFKDKDCQSGCGEIVECGDCNVPRRKIELPRRMVPVTQPCDQAASCKPGCDG